MGKFIETVQKRVGLLISFIDIVMVLTTLIHRLEDGNLIYALSGVNVWFVFLLGIPFFFSVFYEKFLFKLLQVLVFLVMGAANVLTNYEQFYGPAMFFVGWLLAHNYGFMDKHKPVKSVVLVASIVILSQISSLLSSDEGLYAGLSTFWFTVFLVIMLIIIWHDTLRQQDELKKENHNLMINYNELKNKLDELALEKKPFDLKAAGITPAEERVIRVLTVYKASNREIAERLDIAEATVKLHLYNVYNKIGVDSRFAVIELCKYNFE